MFSRFSWLLTGLAATALVLGGLGCNEPTSFAPLPKKAGDTAPQTSPSPTVDIKPIAGFKVYQNSKEKFAMQYPEGWEARENSLNTLVSFLSPLKNKDDKFAENVNVVSETTGDQTISLDQYYKVSEENLKQFFSDFKLLKNEATTLAGLPARMVIYNASQNQLKLRTTQIFTIKDGQAYIVTLTNTQADPTQYTADMLKIAQSFQFLP